MEISPISGVRALAVVKSPPINPELTAIFDIENSPRAGDETFSSSNQKSAGGQDTDDVDDILVDEELESAPVRPSSSDPGRPAQVSFFA